MNKYIRIQYKVSLEKHLTSGEIQQKVMALLIPLTTRGRHNPSLVLAGIKWFEFHGFSVQDNISACISNFNALKVDRIIAEFWSTCTIVVQSTYEPASFSCH